VYQSGESEWKSKLDEAYEMLRQREVKNNTGLDEMTEERTALLKEMSTLRAQLDSSEDTQQRLKLTVDHLTDSENTLTQRLNEYVNTFLNYYVWNLC